MSGGGGEAGRGGDGSDNGPAVHHGWLYLLPLCPSVKSKEDNYIKLDTPCVSCSRQKNRGMRRRVPVAESVVSRASRLLVSPFCS